jgi:hypothetical protein
MRKIKPQIKPVKWVKTAAIAAVLPLGLGLSARAAEVRVTLSPQVSQWLEFFNRDQDPQDRGPGSPGISRGPNGPICVVNPGTGDTLWQQQPLFVLHGDTTEIALRAAGETTPLWTAWTPFAFVRPVTVQYDGEPLTPGANYEWVFYQRQRDRSLPLVLTVPFQVMAAGEERDRISTDFAELETQLLAESASGEVKAQAQAEYFFANQLLADAFQTLFAVSEPTADFAADRDALIAEICQL